MRFRYAIGCFFIVGSQLVLNAQDCEKALSLARFEKASTYDERNFYREFNYLQQNVKHNGFVGLPLEVADIGIKGDWDLGSLKKGWLEKSYSIRKTEMLKGLDSKAYDIYKACLDSKTGLKYAAWLREEPDKFTVWVIFNSPTSHVGSVKANLSLTNAVCHPMGKKEEAFTSLNDITLTTASTPVEYDCKWDPENAKSAVVKLSSSDWEVIPSKGVEVIRLPAPKYTITREEGPRVTPNRCRWTFNAPHFKVGIEAPQGDDPLVSWAVVRPGGDPPRFTNLGRLSAVTLKPEGSLKLDSNLRLMDYDALVIRVGDEEEILYAAQDVRITACANIANNLVIDITGIPQITIRRTP